MHDTLTTLDRRRNRWALVVRLTLWGSAALFFGLAGYWVLAAAALGMAALSGWDN